MTEPEKLIAFIKRAAEMAGTPFTSSPRYNVLSTEFRTGDFIMTLHYYTIQNVLVGTFRPAQRGTSMDYLPVFDSQPTLASVKKDIRLALLERYRDLLCFRTITFLTVLLEFDP